MKKLEDLFANGKVLKVPSYQRAYSWGETQLEQFISDILEIKEKKYYYGHFILEEADDEFEVIDGQQRLTTFVLFLIVCKLYCSEKENLSYKFIEQFETVNYDQNEFKAIQNYSIEKINQKEDFQTLSEKRIFDALKYFVKQFDNKELDCEKINEYIETLTNAHISTHIAKDKSVAVQIFELHNTRGIRLNLIEKVKAKLMKAVYLAETEKTDENIKHIQGKFAEIYQLEEQVNSVSFRGNLSLDEVLLYHLRMVDDGGKLSPSDQKQNIFLSPNISGNREKEILDYLDKSLKEKETVNYITNLVDKFTLTVQFISNELLQFDNQNHLIGDTLIFEKAISTQLFILIRHKFLDYELFFKSSELLSMWERLLFIRDFHEKYYRLQYRDGFEWLFYGIVQRNSIEEVREHDFKYHIEYGFRKEKMDEGSLPKTVSNFVIKRKANILNNAYDWWQSRKIIYVLYKYEREIGANMDALRKIMKKGRSVEHILPQEWKASISNSSNIDKDFEEEINKCIDGIGNLLIITKSENSSVNNQHPKDKNYNSCSGGSYDEHNDNSNKWENHENWKTIIEERGNKIYDFMIDYFQLKPE